MPKVSWRTSALSGRDSIGDLVVWRPCFGEQIPAAREAYCERLLIGMNLRRWIYLVFGEELRLGLRLQRASSEKREEPKMPCSSTLFPIVRKIEIHSAQ
jgi:hypothetical protein